MSVLPQLARVFQDYLAAHPLEGTPVSLYAPAQYIMDLGGKRIRPLLVLLAYDMYRSDYARALPAAHAIEVFHNFTLMHDDIMDNAPLRRNKPTTHTVFGINAGILSGDLMLIKVYQSLNLLEPSYLPEALRLFNQTAIEVCEGQQLDIDFEKIERVTVEQYMRMIELKTSVLLACALSIGGLLAGASHDDRRHLYEFGRLVGLAFQIQDDWLDTFGDPKLVGKLIGGDIIQNKKTWLIARAYELAEKTDAEKLDKLLKSKPKDNNKKIKDVVGILNKYDISQQAHQAKLQCQLLAFEHLDGINVPRSGKAGLMQLAEDLLGRKF